MQVVEQPTFSCIVDRGHPYRTKPSKAEYPSIRRRMGNKSNLVQITPEMLSDAVRLGHSFCPAVLIGGQTEKAWKSQQIFGIDIDCHPGEKSLDPLVAIGRCYEKGLEPMMLYFTMSSTYEAPRYRILFMLDRPLEDFKSAKAFVAALLDVFPEADPACKDLARLFLGSNGEVWDCWKLNYL